MFQGVCVAWSWASWGHPYATASLPLSPGKRRRLPAAPVLRRHPDQGGGKVKGQPEELHRNNPDLFWSSSFSPDEQETRKQHLLGLLFDLISATFQLWNRKFALFHVAKQRTEAPSVKTLGGGASKMCWHAETVLEITLTSEWCLYDERNIVAARRLQNGSGSVRTRLKLI